MTLSDRIYDLGGDDHRIVRHCEPEVQQQFLGIGLSILGVFILCFISSCLTFNKMFSSYFVNLSLSLFFAWMIANIYRLLLCTSAKNTLPHEHKPEAVLVSMAIRILFVWFIAVIIAKPIETWLYKTALDQDIKGFKTFMKTHNRDSIRFYYTIQMEEIKKISHGSAESEKLLKRKEKECLQTMLKMETLVNASEFYLQRIQFLGSRHPSCWFFTAAIIVIFTFPVYLRRRLHTCSYYDLKATVDRKLIDEKYNAFKKQYTDLFTRKFNKAVHFSEPYEDAPYNTLKKEDQRRFHTEEHLLSEIYDA